MMYQLIFEHSSHDIPKHVFCQVLSVESFLLMVMPVNHWFGKLSKTTALLNISCMEQPNNTYKFLSLTAECYHFPVCQDLNKECDPSADGVCCVGCGYISAWRLLFPKSLPDFILQTSSLTVTPSGRSKIVTLTQERLIRIRLHCQGCKTASVTASICNQEMCRHYPTAF